MHRSQAIQEKRYYSEKVAEIVLSASRTASTEYWLSLGRSAEE